MSGEESMAENPKGKHSLNDGQIEITFKAHEHDLREALRRAKAIIDDTSHAKNSDQVSVPVELIRTISNALFAMYRINSGPEQPRSAGDSGDTGGGCDYNPFNGVNIGDPWDGILVTR
jgi:hypothetical protein